MNLSRLVELVNKSVSNTGEVDEFALPAAVGVSSDLDTTLLHQHLKMYWLAKFSWDDSGTLDLSIGAMFLNGRFVGIQTTSLNHTPEYEWPTKTAFQMVQRFLLDMTYAATPPSADALLDMDKEAEILTEHYTNHPEHFIEQS